MAAKKKAKKKQTKKTASKKTPPRNKPAKKKLIQKNTARKKVAVKSKAVGKKTITAKAKNASRKPVRRVQTVSSASFPSPRAGASSGRQSGDLQGLSKYERADSESVDELLEEGNAFEADVVAGVEAADNADEREVHTHEVPEDDVPGEYLDQDE
jgi:hypothetical protein